MPGKLVSKNYLKKFPKHNTGIAQIIGLFIGINSQQ